MEQPAEQSANDVDRASEAPTGKLALVLSGGGARGAFEAGVLEALSEDDAFRNPAIVAGTSAGAINAALLAMRMTPQEIRAFWMELAIEKPVRASDEFMRDAIRTVEKLSWSAPQRTLRALWTRSTGHGGLGAPAAILVEALLKDRYDLVRDFLVSVATCYLIDTEGLRQALMRVFPDGIVDPAHEGPALAINVVDARVNKAVRYVNRPIADAPAEYVLVNDITVDMVLASASIPLLFNPIVVGDRLLWDGGVLNNTPMAPAVALGADRILPVVVSNNGPYTAPQFKNLADAVARLIDMLLENAYNVDRMLLLSRNEIARVKPEMYREVSLYQPIRPPALTLFDAGSYLDFETQAIQSMYERGQYIARDWLKAPKRDRLDLDDHGHPRRAVRDAR